MSIPGPSAITSALCISGLPTDNFTFLGFLPKGSGKREKLLKTFGSLETTLVLYESPFRVKKLLSQIEKSLGGDRMIFVANELTKKFEKVWRGRVCNIKTQIEEITPKGEFTILVSKEGF
ncbi:hypothetical protein JW766_01260 [Candidatus Dojkabacteria bacterium]|nr:hypothetical protein [Candidatus Dojkabacteria bacterium]